jgi:hypothetical protein
LTSGFTSIIIGVMKKMNATKEDLKFSLFLIKHFASRVEEFFDINPQEAKGYLRDLIINLDKTIKKIEAK